MTLLAFPQLSGGHMGLRSIVKSVSQTTADRASRTARGAGSGIRRSAVDPLGIAGPSLPTVGRSISKAAHHPSPSNIASAVLTTAALAGPVGGGVGKAGKAPSVARSAEEVFGASYARPDRYAVTAGKALPDRYSITRAAQTASNAGRAASVARRSVYGAKSGLKAFTIASTAAVGAELARQTGSRSSSHPRRLSPSEGLQAVASVNREKGMAGVHALQYAAANAPNSGALGLDSSLRDAKIRDLAKKRFAITQRAKGK